MSRSLKQVGVAGFMFFTVKGCVWLAIAATAWLGLV
jgi:hypothetical protein